MVRITLDLTGKDATFISNSYRYHSGLSTLELYRNPPDKMFSIDLVKEKIDRLQHFYESSVHGDRIQAALRKAARKEVTEMFKKILHYLQSVATEDDIPMLLQAGFELVRYVSRKKAGTPQPA